MTLPQLTTDDKHAYTGVVLTVFAPFGSDETLSHYPDGQSAELAQHPLYQALLEVASHGIHVCALIDLAQHDSLLVEIAAYKPESARVTSLEAKHGRS